MRFRVTYDDPAAAFGRRGTVKGGAAKRGHRALARSLVPGRSMDATCLRRLENRLALSTRRV